MLSRRKARLLVALLTVMAIIVSGTVSFAASGNAHVRIKGCKAPVSIKAGHGFTVKGKLTSDVRIKRVEIGIASSKTKWTAYKYDNRKVNSKKFNIKAARSKLKFKKLKPGKYYFRIYAHTADGKVHTVLNKKFKVTGKKTPVKLSVKLTGATSPTSIQQGQPFTIRGKISSTKKIRKIKIGVVSPTGKWTSVKYTKRWINGKTYNLANVDAKVRFGKLSAGTYKYRINVVTSSGSRTVINKTFRVEAPEKPAEEEEEMTEAPILTVGSDNIVKLVSAKKPSNYKVGKKFSVSGKIKAVETIQRVEIGVVFASTNKWTGYKYDKKVNAKTFNIADAADSIRFDMLAGGKYKYRIYVHTKSGLHLLLNHPFTVKSSNKPKEALRWALKIARDDDFTYGKKPSTSRVGCYFCGTNRKNKPKGYEKTYVCMTFVHAAYAHGAGDPELLKECQSGRHCLELTNANFTQYSCWEKVGLCKDLKVSDLEPGDVICWYAPDNSSGHLSMYAGNGDIVDAAIEGWGADSIALRKGRAASYLSIGARRSKKSYVMRYRK